MRCWEGLANTFPIQLDLMQQLSPWQGLVVQLLHWGQHRYPSQLLTVGPRPRLLMGEAGPSLMSHYLPAAQNQALLKSQDYIRFYLAIGELSSCDQQCA